MDELVPILGGLLLGLAVVARLPWLRPFLVRAGLAAAVGVAATWASGESWYYLPLDIGEAALAATATWWVAGRLRRARATAPQAR